MLICASCQFANPVDHNFCQRCGAPLAADDPVVKTASAELSLQVRLMPPAQLPLIPDTFLPARGEMGAVDGDNFERYEVRTVLREGRAQVHDTQPKVRSQQQQQLTDLANQPIEQLEAHAELPPAAYPYLLLAEAAPPLYDAWHQAETAVLITGDRPPLASLVTSFSKAVDPLQHVYWMYTLVDLWARLEPIAQWRSSLLQADNLGIGAEQSLCIEQFTAPHPEPPQLPALKAFLKSLLAQPHRGQVAGLRQIRRLILAVSSVQTLSQLSEELAAIGEELLATPAAITPPATTVRSAPSQASSQGPAQAPSQALIASVSAKAFAQETASSPVVIDQRIASASRNALPTNPSFVSSSAMPPIPEPSDKPANNSINIDMESEGDMEPTATASGLPLPEPTLPPGVASVNDADANDSSAPEPDDDDALLKNTLPVDGNELAGDPDGCDSTMVLPMKLVSLEDAGQTNVGRQRDHNEDCFCIASNQQKQSDNSGQKTRAHCLYILCDGMGGHDGGEVASQLAAKTLTDYFETHWPQAAFTEAQTPLPDEVTVIEAVKQANQAIFEVNEQEQRAGHERMGTTLVMVLLQGTSAVVAHVGDSRLYQCARRVGLQQMTIDHEVGQREIQRGIEPDEAYARPDAYQLTQALGPRDSEDLAPSVSYLNFSEDALLLLCSDGLSDNDLVEDYLDSHIDPLLRGQKDLATGVNDLIALGNEVNGHDNITAIAVCLRVSPDLEKGKLASE
ncbi:MAG: serine/threonine phosphatase [Cyanobacteria bacterium J06573_11]